MRTVLSKKVSAVMARKVITLSPDASIKDVKRLFDRHNFNALPVVDGKGKLVGIVSKTDFLRSFTMGFSFSVSKVYDLWATTAKEIMTRSPHTVGPDSSLIDAANVMVEFAYRSVPVVDKSGVLVGMVTSSDIVKYAVEQLASRTP